MAAGGRSVLVLYGSETGNAQDIAEELGRLFQRLHFSSAVEELNAVELSALLQYHLVIFVVSTTGQGDIPHNGLLFWKKLLRRKLPLDCLANLRYTFFGLGDSTYIKFNWAVRKLVRRLDQLGAQTFYDGFEADEQFSEGTEGCFAQWVDGLSKFIAQTFPHPKGLDPIPDDVILPATWSLEPALEKLAQGNVQAYNGVNGRGKDPDHEGPPSSLIPVPDGWDATIIENKRMTPETHWQDVRLVAFNIPQRGSGEKLHCNPGDCLTIYPTNFPEDAQKLISLMGWDDIADQPLDLSICGTLPRGLYTPSQCTLRDLLLYNVDIISVPRRSFLKSMSYFTANPDHKERLLEFTQNQYLDEYFDYATRSRRTILEVLDEFTSVRIPAARLFDVFPLIRGRDFSIANHGSPKPLHHHSSETPVPAPATSTRVEVLAALVRYRTILRKPRQGLCSRYLAALPPNATIRVSYKPVLSPIHGPVNARRPLVAMATGTGIAPVRSLLRERLTHPGTPGPMLLFFGNRNRDADFFFEDEWLEMKEKGLLTCFMAFSRDQKEKVYVQALVRHEAERVGELVRQGAIFAVCGGSTKMADACKDAVFGPLTEEGDEEARKSLLASVTWWQEIW